MPKPCWMSQNEFIPLRFMTVNHLNSARKTLERMKVNTDDIFGSGLNRVQFIKAINDEIEVKDPLGTSLLSKLHKRFGYTDDKYNPGRKIFIPCNKNYLLNSLLSRKKLKRPIMVVLNKAD